LVEFLEIFHWIVEQFHSILMCCFWESSFTEEIMNSFSSIEYFLLWFEVFIEVGIMFKTNETIGHEKAIWLWLKKYIECDRLKINWKSNYKH
jgi:hypothetical protein